MKPLPSRPDLNHLKAQAKDLLAGYRRGAPDAMSRFRVSLPVAAKRDPDTIRQLDLRLHDAQSCIAREYGFTSWADLRTFVEVRQTRDTDPDARAATFCRLVYSGDLRGHTGGARPGAAARYFSEYPDLVDHDPWIACAVGAATKIQAQISTDPSWVNTPGGPLGLTPLIATCHSGLLRVTDHVNGLHETVELLLSAGAEPNQTVASRWPLASLEASSPDHRLSALYGVAGVHHDARLTSRLLAAGADPDDNESLYHALEAPECARLILEAGATVSGTNALYRALDFDDLETFKMVLKYANGAPELKGGRLLLWAIRRRRSAAHIEALLAAGADPNVKTRDGVSAYIQALRYGLPKIADILRRESASETLDEADLFVAACARNDAETARRIKANRPDFPKALSDAQLRLLPELAEAECEDAVRLMVDLGWKIDVQGGDWQASALNQAVFRGNAPLTRYLLENGAKWTEEHGFGDNVCGTLSWASRNRPTENGDWVACARALVDHGMPRAERHPEDPDCVLLDGVRGQFSDEVTQFLLGEEDPEL